jgi:fructose-specific component phosphotransferase system IIB-like protein
MVVTRARAAKDAKMNEIDRNNDANLPIGALDAIFEISGKKGCALGTGDTALCVDNFEAKNALNSSFSTVQPATVQTTAKNWFSALERLM